MHHRLRINIDSSIIFSFRVRAKFQCDINVFLGDDTQCRKVTGLLESMLGFEFLTKTAGNGGRPFAEGSLLI